MVGWPIALGPVLRQHIMLEADGEISCLPHRNWKAKRWGEKGAGSQ
jgi:hypothetical protein